MTTKVSVTPSGQAVVVTTTFESPDGKLKTVNTQKLSADDQPLDFYLTAGSILTAQEA